MDRQSRQSNAVVNNNGTIKYNGTGTGHGRTAMQDKMQRYDFGPVQHVRIEIGRLSPLDLTHYSKQVRIR